MDRGNKYNIITLRCMCLTVGNFFILPAVYLCRLKTLLCQYSKWETTWYARQIETSSSTNKSKFYHLVFKQTKNVAYYLQSSILYIGELSTYTKYGTPKTVPFKCTLFSFHCNDF